MIPEHHTHEIMHSFAIELVMALPFFIAFIGYFLAVIIANKKFKQWPLYRIGLFSLGILSSFLAVMGPLARLAHTDFQIHMLVHLLLGMLAPLLIVLGAPMTILLRALPTKAARKLTGFLRLKPIQLFHHPITASILNMGGLWILYTTDLYVFMHEHILLYLFIHAHIFIAGYLFTASMVYIDPTPHRLSYLYRSLVLLFALTAHAILAKHIYAFPPAGVTKQEAEIGGMVMYYGGDAIDLIIIIMLCLQWYKSTQPKMQPAEA
jgi:putative membrane protein